MDNKLGLLATIVAAAAIGIIWDRVSRRNAEKKLAKVCTIPVLAKISNYDCLAEPIDDEIIDITGETGLAGQMYVVGFPDLEYEYNGKVYNTSYKCREMNLISCDAQFKNTDSIEVLINGEKPEQVYMGTEIDRFARFGVY